MRIATLLNEVVRQSSCHHYSMEESVGETVDGQPGQSRMNLPNGTDLEDEKIASFTFTTIGKMHF